MKSHITHPLTPSLTKRRGNQVPLFLREGFRVSYHRSSTHPLYSLSQKSTLRRVLFPNVFIGNPEMLVESWNSSPDPFSRNALSAKCHSRMLLSGIQKCWWIHRTHPLTPSPGMRYLQSVIPECFYRESRDALTTLGSMSGFPIRSGPPKDGQATTKPGGHDTRILPTKAGVIPVQTGIRKYL